MSLDCQCCVTVSFSKFSKFKFIHLFFHSFIHLQSLPYPGRFGSIPGTQRAGREYALDGHQSITVCLFTDQLIIEQQEPSSIQPVLALVVNPPSIQNPMPSFSDQILNLASFPADHHHSHFLSAAPSKSPLVPF